jgi:hypothetical protein
MSSGDLNLKEQLESSSTAFSIAAPVDSFVARLAEMQSSVQDSFVARLAKIQSSMPDSIAARVAKIQSSMPDSIAARVAKIQSSMPDSIAARVAKIQSSMPDSIAARVAKIQSSMPDSIAARLAKMQSSMPDSIVARLAKMQSSMPDSIERYLKNNEGAVNAFLRLLESGTAERALKAFAIDFPSIAVAGDTTRVLREMKGVGDVHEDQDRVVSSGATVAPIADGISDPAITPIARSDSNDQLWPVSWLLRQPVQYQIILVMLIWLWHHTADVYLDERVKHWIGADQLEHRQEIHYEITQNFGTDAARRFRCVNATALKIRSTPDVKGTAVDLLSRGTAVEVLETRASWTLIRYRAAQPAETREGWGASRYISLDVC